MNENINQLKIMFDTIQKKGWIESKQEGFGGIGRTFEDLLGKEKDNFEFPDFNGIEIKTKRTFSNHTYVTLFNYTPEGNHMNETQRLKDNYGYPDAKLKNAKVLNQSLYANKRTWVGTRHQFMIRVDKEKRKINLYVFHLNGLLIEKDTYWSLDTLEEKLIRKMSVLAFVNADSKMMDGKEYFKYTSISFYQLKGIDTFIQLLEKGKIRVSFKIGVFREGKRFGQTHDRGTSFEIEGRNLTDLFEAYPNE